MRRHRPRVVELRRRARSRIVRDRARSATSCSAARLPFGCVAVRAQGRVHERDRAAHPLAGADRRRRRRRGDLGQAARRQLAARRWSRWTSTTTGCRSTPTRPSTIRSRIFLEGNFYVDLHPGHAERADPRLGRDAAGRQHVGAGAARPRAVGAATPTRAPTSRRCVQGFGASLNGQPTAAAGRRPGPDPASAG